MPLPERLIYRNDDGTERIVDTGSYSPMNYFLRVVRRDIQPREWDRYVVQHWSEKRQVWR